MSFLTPTRPLTQFLLFVAVLVVISRLADKPEVDAVAAILATVGVIFWTLYSTRH